MRRAGFVVFFIAMLSIVLPYAADARSWEIFEVSRVPYRDAIAPAANVDDGPVSRALAARNEIDYLRWFHDNFHPIDQPTRDAAAHYPSDFAMAIILDEGFDFASSRGRIRYEHVPCSIFDCYRGYLSLADARGKLRWRRRVPNMALPVFPFEVEGHLVFLGYPGDGRTLLYSLDLSSGRLSKGYGPPSESFDKLFPDLFFPYVFGRHVVISDEIDIAKDGTVLGDPTVYVLQWR